MPDRIASTFASRFRRPAPEPEPPAIERPRRRRQWWSLLPVSLAFALFGAVPPVERQEEPAAAPAPPGSEIATATPPQAPPPRAPISADGDFRIQLAAVRSEADAQRAWQLFMGDLGFMLADVEPIFERADTAHGVFYRVQIGPFASQEAAESLCEQLKRRNASCFVIRR